MTTPARNVSTYYNAPGQFYQKLTCAGGYSLTTNSSYHDRFYLDQRPASVSSPKNRAGWRNPLSWSHKHLEAVVSPHGTMRTRNWCANKTQFTGNMHTDGAYLTDTGMGTYLVGVPPWLSDLARTRAYLALKNQKVNLSVAFAEREQAKRMFSSGVTDIAKQIERYRFFHPRQWGQVLKYGLRRQWKDIPSRWLELQYGWKPFMSDLYGTLDEMSRRQAGVDMAFHARAKGSASWEEIFQVPLGSSPYYWVETVRRKHHAKVILYYKLNSPVMASLASLGLTNPLELGWELVKYSFVVDWFLPIGNWLSTFDADFGWSYETGCQSLFTHIEVTSDSKAIPSTPSSSVENFTVGPRAKGIVFNRNVLSSPPVVGLPHFKNPLSAVHVANAMSLLVNAFH